MPSDIEFLEKIITQDNFTDFNCDLAIIGGGPAAITAAQYAHKGGISVTIFEPRGLARKVTHHSVHFLPGLDGSISGPEFARIMASQIHCPVEEKTIEQVMSLGPRHHILISGYTKYHAKTVLIATGLKHRKLGFPGEEDFRARGVFIALDAQPNVDAVRNLIALDNQDFIITNEAMMTNVPGIFAAGDVRAKYLRQVITACADGATAALAIENYLRELV